MGQRPQWLKRYHAGEQALVWHELRQLGARVREPAFAPEAQAVCEEMARRARRNLEVIIDRLERQGYRFHRCDDAHTPTPPLLEPTAGAEEHLRWLEGRFGPVPMTLAAWVRIVGDVWLVGTHPRWLSSVTADPLVLEVEGSRYRAAGIRASLEDEFEVWEQDRGGEPFGLPVAPDRRHKQHAGGGRPYRVFLPEAGADGHVSAAAGMPLVGYLRWVFAHGGFPHPSLDYRQAEIERTLAADLLPL